MARTREPLTPEERKARHVEYMRRYRENPDRKARHAEYMRQYRKENPERYRAYRKKWRENNPEKVRAYARYWIKMNPDKVRAYKQRYKEKRQTISAHYPAFGELRLRELLKIEIYAAARKALPDGLPAFVRDEIIADIILAHLEGRLPVADVAAKAKQFVTAYYRMFDQWKTISLDAPVPGTDGLRLGDTIAAEDI